MYGTKSSRSTDFHFQLLWTTLVCSTCGTGAVRMFEIPVNSRYKVEVHVHVSIEFHMWSNKHHWSPTPLLIYNVLLESLTFSEPLQSILCSSSSRPLSHMSDQSSLAGQDLEQTLEPTSAFFLHTPGTCHACPSAREPERHSREPER